MDSYVNVTQILKVVGIDKGRRTKIFEKEILPGKYEIVQGGCESIGECGMFPTFTCYRVFLNRVSL